jgi:hypothetical protein
MNSCQGFTAEGEPCPAPAGEDGYCLFHSPSRTEAAQAARRLGGLSRRPQRSSVESPGDLNNLDDLRCWLNSTLQDTWALDNSVRRSTALSSLLKIGVDVIGQNEIDHKIEALERLIHDGSQK